MAKAVKSQDKFTCIAEALNDNLALESPNDVNFGIEFKNTVTAYYGSTLKAEELDDVKSRCRQYLIILLSELLKRVPGNNSILKTAKNLSPNAVLNTASKVTVADLPLEPIRATLPT